MLPQRTNLSRGKTSYTFQLSVTADFYIFTATHDSDTSLTNDHTWLQCIPAHITLYSGLEHLPQDDGSCPQVCHYTGHRYSPFLLLDCRHFALKSRRLHSGPEERDVHGGGREMSVTPTAHRPLMSSLVPHQSEDTVHLITLITYLQY